LATGEIAGYPSIKIRMCDRGLEPASRVFGTTISAVRLKEIDCPPDGRGMWEVKTRGKKAEQTMAKLSPLIPLWETLSFKTLVCTIDVSIASIDSSEPCLNHMEQNKEEK